MLTFNRKYREFKCEQPMNVTFYFTDGSEIKVKNVKVIRQEADFDNNLNHIGFDEEHLTVYYNDDSGANARQDIRLDILSEYTIQQP